MHPINRAAIVVRPKRPFFDWAQSLERGLPESTKPWTSVYVVAAHENDPPDKVIRRCFGAIFEEQLAAWHGCDNDWPTPRTLPLFRQWFEIEFVDLVFDLSAEPIEHDD